jgi:hypothetical protein
MAGADPVTGAVFTPVRGVAEALPGVPRRILVFGLDDPDSPGAGDVSTV